MPEHRIRLRGGWDCLARVGDDPEGAEVVSRVDLPVAWPADAPRLVRLARQFGRPPVDAARERVDLELRHVPGLKAATLNGRPVAPGVVAGDDWSIPLGEPLLPRNGLILDVELGPDAPPDSPWGEVAIVIRPR